MTKRLKLPFQTVLHLRGGQGHGGEMFAPPYPLAPTQVTLSGGQGHGGDISSPLNLAGGQRHGGENFVYAPILALSGGHGHGGEIGQPVSAIGAHGHGGQITLLAPTRTLEGGHGHGGDVLVTPAYIRMRGGHGHGGELRPRLNFAGGHGHGGQILARSNPLNLAGGQGHGGDIAALAAAFAMSGGHGHGGALALPPSIVNSALTRYMFTDSNVTRDGSDLVTQWRDKNPLSGTVSNSGSGSPLYVASAINTQPALRFNGSLNFLSGAGGGLITAAQFTAFVVFKASSITANSSISFYNQTLISTTGGWWGLHLRTPNIVIAQNYTLSGDTSVTRTLSSPTALTIATVWHGGNELNLQLNQGTVGTIASGDTGSISDTFRIGRITSGAYYAGDIGAILIYNTALSDVDRTYVQNYLNEIYAVF